MVILAVFILANVLLELEGAEVERLEAFDVLDDALLGQFFLVGRPPPQNLLQALDLHQALLDGRVVRVGLQHLEDDLELAVLLFLVDLLLAELPGEEGGRLLGVGAGSGC